MNDREDVVLVAACGNPVAADDEFGLLVARALEDDAADRVPGMSVVNLAAKPAAIMDYLPGPGLLIVVDATWSNTAETGRLIEMDWFSSDRPPLVRDVVLESQGLSITDDLALAKRLGVLPDHVRLIAVTVGSTRIGGSLRHEVRRQVPQAAHRITDCARQWLRHHRDES